MTKCIRCGKDLLPKDERDHRCDDANLRKVAVAFALACVLVSGCRKELKAVPAGLYWPEGTPAQLAKDCKLDARGARPVEPCKFRVTPSLVKVIQ